MNLLQGLNPEQEQAVLYDEGSLLVLAGAGSGKTRVITHRFAHLVQKHGLGVHNILCVTFTNKAAGEMKERISRLLGVDTHSAWVRTFHSMCVRILRRHAPHIGYPADFTIYDASDTKNTVKKIMERLNFEMKEVNHKAVLRAIGKAKEDFISPEGYKNKARDGFEQGVAEVYAAYQEALRANQAMDFSDLINNTIVLLENNAEVRKYYQNMWSYIMADEFQDTNEPQYRLLALLSRDRGNVCVVGDDDQSIYGWRGAKVENITRFHTEFKAHVIRLERNYRSHGNILTAANEVVKGIKGRMPKTLKAQREQGNKITFAALGDDRLQASFVYEELAKNLKDNNYKDFAILYRINAQSRLIEEVLTRHRVPFQVFGGQKFYDRAEVKDILCYLRLIVNPKDEAAFSRIANIPKRKVGEKSLENLLMYARTQNIDFHQACAEAARAGGLSSVSVAALEKLGALFAELRPMALESEPVGLIRALLEGIAYQAYLFDEYGREEGESRMENISELINSVKSFEELNPEGSLTDFLNEASLLSGGEENSESLQNSVSVMSIHSAKGLEFPTVFVIGLVEGILPLGSAASPEELNEEKRLFYVAVTRAMDKLYLTYEKRSQRYGEWGSNEPSHFLSMIPKEVLNEVKTQQPEQPYYGGQGSRTYGGQKSYGVSQNKRAPVTKRITAEDILNESPAAFQTEAITNISDLREGQRILHNIFGEGTIEYVSSAMLRINFKRFGRQVLMGNIVSSVKKIVG